jgi:hypothetical protein
MLAGHFFEVAQIDSGILFEPTTQANFVGDADSKKVMPIRVALNERTAGRWKSDGAFFMRVLDH